MTNFTADQLALEAHINAENAGRENCEVVSDPAHWAGYEIFTIAAYEHYMAACNNFEITRDIHSYKPNWARYANMSVEQIEAETTAMIEHEHGLAAVDAAAAQKLADDLGHSLEDLKRWNVV